ncbi:MAG: hypothetical protein LBS68_03560 [Puniceicoccales bacterium]|nr:hypothetical protein [Puniceicoccales bacterium]
MVLLGVVGRMPGKILPVEHVEFLLQSRAAALSLLDIWDSPTALLGAAGTESHKLFTAVSGGMATIDAGPNADVDVLSFSRRAGIAIEKKLGDAYFAIGPFTEFGGGKNKNKNIFSDYDDMAYSTTVCGKVEHAGIGILWRLVHGSGFFADGDLCIGLARCDLDPEPTGAVLLGAEKIDPSAIESATKNFKMTCRDGAGRVGIGFDRQFENWRLSLHSRYEWAHLANDRDYFPTESLDSSRWRSGFSLDREGMGGVAPYVQFIYEREFDGRGATGYFTYSEDFAPISMNLAGDCYVCELGVHFHRGNIRPLEVTVGVRGCAGMRRAIFGHFHLCYNF